MSQLYNEITGIATEVHGLRETVESRLAAQTQGLTAQFQDLRSEVDKKLEIKKEPLNMVIDLNGSDTTGNGSEAKPFATLRAAFSKVPLLFVGNIQIKIKAGTYVIGAETWGDLGINGALPYGSIRSLTMESYSGAKDVVLDFGVGANPLVFSDVFKSVTLRHLKFTNTSNNANIISAVRMLRIKAYIFHCDFLNVNGTNHPSESASGLELNSSECFLHSCTFNGSKVGVAIMSFSRCAAFNCSGSNSKYGYYLDFSNLTKAGSNITGGTAGEFNNSSQVFTSY